MRTRKIDFDTVSKIALALPAVEEGTTYGSPALKIRGKLLACLPVHKSAEPNSLAVRIGFDRRSQLMTADPDVYYLKDHYVNYPVVLVRLSCIRLEALEELLREAWQFVTASRRADPLVRSRHPRRPAARKAPGPS